MKGFLMEKYIGYYKKGQTLYAVLGSCKYMNRDQKWQKGIVYLKDNDFYCIPISEFERNFSKSVRGKYG